MKLLARTGFFTVVLIAVCLAIASCTSPTPTPPPPPSSTPIPLVTVTPRALATRAIVAPAVTSAPPPPAKTPASSATVPTRVGPIATTLKPTIAPEKGDVVFKEPLNLTEVAGYCNDLNVPVLPKPSDTSKLLPAPDFQVVQLGWQGSHGIIGILHIDPPGHTMRVEWYTQNHGVEKQVMVPFVKELDQGEKVCVQIYLVPLEPTNTPGVFRVVYTPSSFLVLTGFQVPMMQ